LIPAFQALARERDGVEVVAVADLDFERAQSVAADLGVPAAFRSHQEMLETGTVNAVVVAVPHRFHADEALRALRAGCDVFVEKPMAATARQARVLLQEAQARGRVLMVDYQYPRQLAGVLAGLDAGLIGDRGLVRGAFSLPDGFPDRPVFWNHPDSGGVRLDLLGHLVSVTLAAVGESHAPLAVSAQGWRHLGVQALGPAFQTEHKVCTTVRFSGNVRAELEVDWAAYRRVICVEVEGVTGLVEIPMMGAELDRSSFVPRVHRRQADGSIQTEVLSEHAPTPTEESFVRQAEAFDDAVRQDTQLAFPFDPNAALTVQEILDAVGRSIELGGKEVLVRRS
jgi:predicted dehydrogenase